MAYYAVRGYDPDEYLSMSQSKRIFLHYAKEHDMKNMFEMYLELMKIYFETIAKAHEGR